MSVVGLLRTRQDVIAPPTISSVIGVLLAVLHNPNPGWDEHSRFFALLEVEAAGIPAGLIGYDQEEALRVHVRRRRHGHVTTSAGPAP